MIESSSRGILGETYGRRGIGLGIAIDEKSGLFGNGEAGSQIHCRGGLSDPALLVCHGDDSSQIIFPERKSNKASLRMQDVSRGTYLLGGDSDVSAPSVPRGTLGEPNLFVDIGILFHVERLVIARTRPRRHDSRDCST